MMCGRRAADNGVAVTRHAVQLPQASAPPAPALFCTTKSLPGQLGSDFALQTRAISLFAARDEGDHVVDRLLREGTLRERSDRRGDDRGYGEGARK